MLEISELSYSPTADSFATDSLSLLEEISFNISSGEFISILGPNGAGKTTLLRCLFGILPYQGSIKLFKKEVRNYSRKELAQKISYIPQLTDTLPPYTVRELVSMGRHPHLKSILDSSSKDTKIIDSALETTDCLGLSERLVSTLSGGERQRVLLSAALAQETEIILMDEPGAFLDPKHEKLLYQALSELKDKTLVIVSHDLNRSIISSQRIIALKSSKLVFDGGPENICEDKILEDLYSTDFSRVLHPDNGRVLALP